MVTHVLGNFGVLSVSDRRVGMHQEIMDNIFDIIFITPVANLIVFVVQSIMAEFPF